MRYWGTIIYFPVVRRPPGLLVLPQLLRYGLDGFVPVPELRVLVLHQRDQRELLGGISELEEILLSLLVPPGLLVLPQLLRVWA